MYLVTILVPTDEELAKIQKRYLVTFAKIFDHPLMEKIELRTIARAVLQVLPRLQMRLEDVFGGLDFMVKVENVDLCEVDVVGLDGSKVSEEGVIPIWDWVDLLSIVTYCIYADAKRRGARDFGQVAVTGLKTRRLSKVTGLKVRIFYKVYEPARTMPVEGAVVLRFFR